MNLYQNQTGGERTIRPNTTQYGTGAVVKAAEGTA